MSEQAILLGVPKVEYGPDGITPLPMCLTSCAHYLGMDISYDYMMAATGAAFRLVWNTKAWDGGNVGTILTFDDPSKIFRLGLTALGCEYNLVGRNPDTKKAEFIHFIKAKIDAGIPVIARGLIGPPEECIVTGYRDNGSTLLGWNFFQDNPEFAGHITHDESGYFITGNWWENPNTNAVFSLSDGTGERFTPKTILQHAIETMTGRMDGNYAKGTAAYEAWAEAILNDDEFSEHAVLPVLAERLMCQGDAMDCLADGRNQAALYLNGLIPTYPAYQKQLKEAAALFKSICGLMEKMNGMLGGWQRNENAMRMLAKPHIRKQLADIIDAAGSADKQALSLIKELAAVV